MIVGSCPGGTVALGIESPAGRVLIEPATRLHLIRLPGLPREWSIPKRTLILHSGADELVPFEASVRLLQEAARITRPGEAEAIGAIRGHQQSAGYTTLHDRLVRMGRDRRCNEPDPQDTWNKDADPQRAMIGAVRIVANTAA